MTSDATAESMARPGAGAGANLVDTASTDAGPVQAPSGSPAQRESKAGFNTKPSSTKPSAAANQARAGVLMIGDSLTVGTQAYMPESIDGAPVQIDATSGIPIAEGMRRYERHQARGNMPRVVEMALFTNNSPDQIGQLRGSIDTTIRDAHARGGRVVWATIVRPGDYSEANDLIRAKAAENPDVMGVVDWEKMVAEDPGLVGGDGVHATAKGYEARAEAFTEAARD